MLQMAEEGAGVHFEDQLAPPRNAVHMGGKVLVPAFEFIQNSRAARADVAECHVLVAAPMPIRRNCSQRFDERTNHSHGERTEEVFSRIRSASSCHRARASLRAVCGSVWCETSRPICTMRASSPKPLAVHPDSCSLTIAPLIQLRENLDDRTIGISKMTRAMGYKFQFVTLAGFTR